MNRIIGLAAVLTLLAGATQAAPYSTPLGLAVNGPVYFWKPGADMAVHDADLEACKAVAQRTTPPIMYLGSAGDGLVGAMFQGEADKHAVKQTLQANIENCMVVRGWDVVRFDHRKGEILAKMDTAKLHRAIERRLLAPEPEGEKVRVGFQSFDSIKFRAGLTNDQRRESLSLAALGPQPDTLHASLPAKGLWQTLEPIDPASVGPGDSVIVFRQSALKPDWISLRLLRLDDVPWGKDAAVQPIRYIQADSPPMPIWAKKERWSKLLVYKVPPGRWAVAGDFTTSFCLGAPAFEVRSGEAIWAGHFDAADGSKMTPDLALEGAAAGLPQALAGRLKPAAYVNGVTYTCAALAPMAIYAYEMPGAPFEPGYAYGSMARKP